MKKIFTASCLLLGYTISMAQHTEFFAGSNAGVLSFRGRSAVNSSFIVQSDRSSIGNYSNDIYSKKSGIGVGIDIGVVRLTKSRFTYGFVTGMELLKHRVPITDVTGMTGSFAATGVVNIHSHFINLKPLAGYRFSLTNKISFDVVASLEIAIGLAYLYEVGSVTIKGSGEVITIENDRDEIITDVRTGVQAKMNLSRYSVLLGYWLGQSNYYKRYIGGNPEAYSKLFRMGLTYRLNKGKRKG